jgi:DNA-binding MarR family transcriptional regulator
MSASPTAAEPDPSPQPSQTGREIRVERMRRGLLPLVMQAFFYSRRSFDEAMRSHGLTGSQAGMLSRIYDQPGISGAELSRQMLTTPQAVQLMLATLERKGLIEREPDPTKGRVLGSHLTEAGNKAFHECLADAADADRGLSQGLDDEERQQLMELLQKYIRGTQLPADAEDPAADSTSAAS